MSLNNRDPYQFDSGQIGAFEQNAAQIFNISQSTYGAAPNPQILNEALGTGLSSNLVSAYNTSDPAYRSILTSSATGQPLNSGADYNSLANSLNKSVSTTSTYNFDQTSYLQHAADGIGNDQTLAALGENPIANAGYFQSLSQASPDRVSKYQHFLQAHGLLQQKDVTGSWDTTTSDAMRQYMVARYMPDALYGKGDQQTNAKDFLDAVGMPVQDLITANQHSTGQDFQKQVFMDWLRMQDPQAQRDALNNYVQQYGKGSVPQSIADLAGGGFFDSLGDSVMGFVHSGGPLGFIPGVGSAVGEVLSKPVAAVGNLFQLTKLHSPTDLFEDTRDVKSSDMLQGFSAQDKSALGGIQAQVAHSMGFFGILDGYERMRVQALYGGLYNLYQLSPLGDRKFENPFDPNTSVGMAAQRSQGDILGALKGTPVGDALTNLPVMGALTSFTANLLTDPLTFLPPAKAMKVAGRAVLAADRAVPLAMKPTGLQVRGFNLSRPVYTAPGEYTFVGRNVLPMMQSPMEVLFHGKLRNLMDQTGVMDVLHNRNAINDAQLEAEARHVKEVEAFEEEVARGNAEHEAEMARLDSLTPDSPEVAAHRAQQMQVRGLDKPPTPASVDWHIHSQPDTYQLAEVEALSEAEKQQIDHMVRNEFRDRPKPQTVPDEMLTAKTDVAGHPDLHDPYHALMQTLFQRVDYVGDRARYYSPRTPEVMVEARSQLVAARAELRTQAEKALDDMPTQTRLAPQIADMNRRIEAFDKAIKLAKHATAQGVESGDLGPSQMVAGQRTVKAAGDARLIAFRDAIFGNEIHELTGQPLTGGERDLLRQLMERKMKLEAEQAMARAKEGSSLLPVLQSEWEASRKSYIDEARAHVIAQRHMPGPTLHPAKRDPEAYAKKGYDNFHGSIVNASKVIGGYKKAAKGEGVLADEEVGLLPGTDMSGAPDLGPISERIDPDKPKPTPGKRPNVVYVGRIPRFGDTFWGNPFRVDDELKLMKGEGSSLTGNDARLEAVNRVIAKFASFVVDKPEMMARIKSLRGKQLACHHTDTTEPCHGDVLLQLAEDSFYRVDKPRARTHMVTGSREWGRRPQDRKIMLAVLAKELQPGDTLVHGAAQGADEMAADIVANELRHLQIKLKAEPVTDKEWQPPEKANLPPITGTERIKRPLHGGPEQKFTGMGSDPQFTHLRERVLMSGFKEGDNLFQHLLSMADNPTVRKELLSTAGHELKLSEDANFNAALTRVRIQIAGGHAAYKKLERAAHTDMAAGHKRNRRMLEAHKPDQVHAFDPHPDDPSKSTGTKGAVAEATRRGVPTTVHSVIPDHAQERARIIRAKQQVLKAEHARQVERFKAQHAEGYIAQQKLDYLEKAAAKPEPLRPPPPLSQVDHAGEVHQVVQGAAITKATDTWHIRLQEMAQIIMHPKVGADELIDIMNFPDDERGLAMALDLKTSKDTGEVMRKLSSPENKLSHNFMDLSYYTNFQEVLKGLTAVREGKATNSRLVRFLNQGGIQMTDGALDFLHPQEAVRKIRLALTAVGVDSAEIARINNAFLGANDPIARQSIVADHVYRAIQMHYDTHPVLKALGGWQGFEKWKWGARTREGQTPVKTIAYAPKKEGEKMVEQSRGKSSTGDIMKDTMVDELEAAIKVHENVLMGEMVRRIGEATHAAEHPTTWDYNSAKEFVLRQTDEQGRNWMEAEDSRHQAMIMELEGLTGGTMGEGRAVPFLESQQQWKGLLPMTPYEAVVYRNKVLRNSEKIQDKIRADWLSTKWKQVVLTRVATSMRIALGDEISRFALFLLAQGHPLAAAQYVGDNLKGLATALPKAGVRQVYKRTQRFGKETPKWATKKEIDPHIMWTLAGAFHLMSDHSISVFSPGTKNYEKALERMFSTTFGNSKLAKEWAQHQHRDFDIHQHLLDAERSHAIDNHDAAMASLEEAQRLLVARSAEMPSTALKAFDATMSDYMHSVSEMQKKGTYLEQVAKSPDFKDVLRQLKDDQANADVAEALKSGDFEGAQKMMAERGLTTEKSLLDIAMSTTQLHYKKPKLDLVDVRRELELKNQQAALDHLKKLVQTPLVREGQAIPDPEVAPGYTRMYRGEGSLLHQGGRITPDTEEFGHLQTDKLAARKAQTQEEYDAEEEAQWLEMVEAYADQDAAAGTPTIQDAKGEAENLRGQWFTPDKTTAEGYVRGSQKGKIYNDPKAVAEEDAKAGLYYVDVPTADLEGYSTRNVIPKTEGVKTTYINPKEYILPEHIRAGVVKHGARVATAEEAKFSRQMREMRRINRIYLKPDGVSEDAAAEAEHQEALRTWHQDRYHAISSMLDEMSRRNAEPLEYSKLDRRTEEDLGVSVRRTTDEHGLPLGVTGKPKPGTRRAYRVKGGNPREVLTDLEQARDKAAETIGSQLEYVDLPAGMVDAYEGAAWMRKLPGEAIPGRDDHTLHNQAAKAGWGDLREQGKFERRSFKAQAYAQARYHRAQAAHLEGERGMDQFYEQRVGDWAQHTHDILQGYTKHPMLAKALYNGGQMDMKELSRVLQQDRYAETHMLPDIAQPVSNMETHRGARGKAGEVFNWYHDHVTQAMVNYARSNGVLKMREVFSNDLANHYNLAKDDPEIQRIANAQAMHWMQKNTYQGQRSVMAQSLRSLFPFWGATANMSRFWASLLSSPIKIGGHNTHMYPMMPALNFMSASDQSSQNGGIHIPVKLAHFMGMLGMANGDEATIDPSHMFFFTQDGINSFIPSFGPVMSYGLDMASSFHPELVDTISQFPVIGQAYSQYINTNGFNPILGWGSQMLGGAIEATTGKLPQDTLLGQVPGLFSSGAAEHSKIINKERQQSANALQDAHDKGQPSADLSDAEGKATHDVGISNIFQGVSSFFVPMNPKVVDERTTHVTAALKQWDVAGTDAEKAKVIADNPDVAPLLQYFDRRTPTMTKEQLALDHPWITPYATSKYQHPEGAQFTPTIQDFHNRLQAGDINLDSPNVYMNNVKKNVSYNQASIQYALLKAQEEEYLRDTGVASTSSAAKSWRQQYYYPALDQIANLHKDWADQFIRQPGYSQVSKYVESRPLRTLMSWEVIPQFNDLGSSTTATWQQIQQDVHQAAGTLSDLQANGGSEGDKQALMNELNLRLQGYAAQDHTIAEQLQQFHFGRIEDLVQAEAQ